MYGAQAFSNDTPGIDVTKFAGIPGVAKTKSAAEMSGNRYEEMANPFTNLRSILEEIAYDIKKKHIGNNKKELSLIVSLLCLILYKPKIVNNIIIKVIGLVSISKPYISIV